MVRGCRHDKYQTRGPSLDPDQEEELKFSPVLSRWTTLDDFPHRHIGIATIIITIALSIIVARRLLVNKGEEGEVEGTHGLQMLDGSPLARLPTIPRFNVNWISTFELKGRTFFDPTDLRTKRAHNTYQASTSHDQTRSIDRTPILAIVILIVKIIICEFPQRDVKDLQRRRCLDEGSKSTKEGRSQLCILPMTIFNPSLLDPEIISDVLTP